VGKRRRITASELMKQLESDPPWVADREERDARHAARAEALDADEASLIADLAAAGICVESVYDFVGKGSAPPSSLPVLLRHLNAGHLPVLREGVIRALGIPSARALALEPLCAAYRAERDPSMRWLIANALAGMAHFDEVKGLPGIEEYAPLFRE
jgi:hypothetical protein